jgi:hypothetical protein
MHIEMRCAMDLDAIVEAISNMSGPDLERVREAVDSRRERLAQSTVVERRSYASGILQLEYRANSKTGTQRGPYWYFHYREGGRQRTLYVGKTDDPEAALAEKLALSE